MTTIGRSQRGLGWVLILVLPVLVGIGPGWAESPHPSIHEEHEELYDRVRSSPTFVLEETVRLRGDTTTLTFLFDNLDVSGDLLRVWNLGHFEVTEEADRYYRATKGDDLAGTCYQLLRESGRVVFVGEGVYRPDHSPINVPGTAVVSVKWTKLGQGRLELDVTLMLRPNYWLVRWLGTLLHPLVRPPLVKSFNRLIERGPRLMDKLRDHPEQTLRKLSEHHPQAARSWKHFLENRAVDVSPTRDD